MPVGACRKCLRVAAIHAKGQCGKCYRNATGQCSKCARVISLNSKGQCAKCYRAQTGQCAVCRRVAVMVAEGVCRPCYKVRRTCSGRHRGDGVCHRCGHRPGGGDRYTSLTLPELGPRHTGVIAYRGGPLALGALTAVQADALADVLKVWRRAGLGDGLRKRHLPPAAHA